MYKLTIFNNEVIPVYILGSGEKVVIGRELHERLKINERYNDWFPRMCGYGFTANTDFQGFTEKTVKPQGGRPAVNHYIKLDMAKHIAMLQRTPQGFAVRQKLIELERRVTDTSRLLDFTPLQKYLEEMLVQNRNLTARIEKLEKLPHALMLEIGAAHDRIDRLTPKALPPSCLAKPVSKYPITISEIAALYGMGGATLNKLLYGFKVIYRSGRHWKLYATYTNQGYMELDRWTEKGESLIHKTLKLHGVSTLSEKERAFIK